MVAVIVIMSIVIIAAISTGVYLYNHKRDKYNKDLYDYVMKNIGHERLSEDSELHYLLKSEYENCLNSLDLAMLLPDSLVCVKDKIMMALTLSSDETIRVLATKFFDISDLIHLSLSTGLVKDFADAESMLDSLREKFIELIVGRCSIEEILDSLNKTLENATVLYEIAKRRANGDYRCFNKVDLDSWSEILDKALDETMISGSNNVTELVTAAKTKIG